MAKTFWLNQKFNINLPIWTLLSPSIVTKYCRFSAGGAFDLASLGYHHEYRDGDFFDGVSFCCRASR